MPLLKPTYHSNVNSLASFQPKQEKNKKDGEQRSATSDADMQDEEQDENSMLEKNIDMIVLTSQLAFTFILPSLKMISYYLSTKVQFNPEFSTPPPKLY